MHPLQCELFLAPNYVRGSWLTIVRVFALSLCRPPQPQDSHLRCPHALLALSPASLRMSALRRLPPDIPAQQNDSLLSMNPLARRTAYRLLACCVHTEAYDAVYIRPLDTPTVHTGVGRRDESKGVQ
ncbi:hypothetical protein B0H13DRAFT_2302272 [Mycena leptocephala]|nr:hypothetical protein B0H13DRAFT_2302272 [Mycena leptocephala]